MKMGLNYGLFMIITMALLHLNQTFTMFIAFIIALIWSIYMLFYFVMIEREWNWFFSSTLTWALIGIYYIVRLEPNQLYISQDVIAGTLLSFSFMVNSIASMISPRPFTTLFNQRGSIMVHHIGTVLWIIFIFLNLLFSIYLHQQSYSSFSILVMINIFIGIFLIKRLLKQQNVGQS